MEQNILHITDLHLDDFHGTDEHLRRGFYKEYIDELVGLIGKKKIKVDTIIVTGDLVNQGKVENLKFVEIIIKYLAKEINVSDEQICFCIGNHDYKYKTELTDGSNSKIVRKHYLDFVKLFNHKIIFENQRFSLIEVNQNIFYLSIDSTLGSHDLNLQGKPGIIKQNEIDEILSEVLREKIPQSSLLLIGCHYPIIAFPSGLPSDSEDNWEENHLWKSANALRTRINNIKLIDKIWFMGDCHIPDHIQFEEAYFIMTGRFGGSTNITNAKYISQIPRQCKIVTFCSESETIPVHTFSFEAATHKDNPNYGKWSLKTGEIRIIKPPENRPLVQKEKNAFLHLINSDTEEMILSRIKEKDLYSFGRFITSKKNTSLGWVNINQLLNSTELLSNIVDKSLKYIDEQLNISYGSSIIVGLDFWGTIIGSHISIRTGMKNFAIATRGNGQYHSIYELTNNYLESELKNCKEVLFIIDVISCGDTIKRLTETYALINDKIIFHVVSVISNSSTINVINFEKIKSAGTFCEKLNIPVIKNDELPDCEFLPASIDISPK